MRSVGRGSVAGFGVVSFIALTALFLSPDAPAHPAHAMQPHYCGMIEGAPWTIRIRKASCGFETKRGDTYAVSSGWQVFGCPYAKATAARLTHEAANRLQGIRFPTLHLTCSRIGPEDVGVGPLAVYGWCGRLRDGSKIAASVYFFWSPSGDPLQ